MRYRTIIGALLLSFIIVALADAEPSNWGEVTAEEWATVAPERYPEAQAVVLFDRGHAEWEAKSLRFTRHRRIKVLSSATDSVGLLRIEIAEYDHLDELKALVLRSDGTRTELDKDDITEEAEHGDLKIFTARLNGAQPGDIIDWFYEIDYYGGFEYLGPMKLLFYAIKFGGLTADFTSFLEALDRQIDRDLEQFVRNLPPWYFDSRYYTFESRLKVDLMTRINFGYYPSNMPEESVEPEFEENWIAGYKYYTWTLTDIAPCTAAEPTPAGRSDRAAIYFNMLTTGHGCEITRSIYSNDYWVQIGLGLRAYLHQYCDRDGGCHRRAKKLVRKGDSERARIDSIYNYVAREYRQELPIVALRPLNWNVGNFYKGKEGAAFESNILLMEMLREVGIKALPVFINTRGRVSFRETGCFDHMIVLAEARGEPVFLDACLGSCTSGSLPPFSGTMEGLVVTDESLKFCIVEANQCSKDYSIIETDVP